MGCLSFLVEFIFESLIDEYIHLMQRIIPAKLAHNIFGKILKFIIGTFAVIYLVSMALGLIELIFDDHKMGAIFFFIPLAIILIQIGLGLIINKSNNSDKNETK